MDIGNKINIFYITENARSLAQRLQGLYPDARIQKFNSNAVSKLWGESKNLIFIMSLGIVVRTISSLIKDKKTDPAVIVLDEKGKHAISLLSGHLGGANKLAEEIADFLGGEAVITTASDTNNLPAIDLWAREKDLVIENWKALPRTSTKFLNTGKLKVYSDIEIKMSEEFQKTNSPESADVVITNKSTMSFPLVGNLSVSPAKKDAGQAGMTKSKDKKLEITGHLLLRPKNLIVGIGCNSSTPENEIGDAVKATLDKNNLSLLSIQSIATIDIKGNEPGLIAFAKKYNLGIKTFTANELNTVKGISRSDAAFKATGAYAVAEPAAILASENGKLLVKKKKVVNVTIAIAELHRFTPSCSGQAHSPIHPSGGIYIVGTGPGNIEHITPYARAAIRNSDAIVGYGTYLDLIEDLIKDKEVISTGMTQEIDRCKKAVELALSGKTVAVISGGDPGIYAMAGLLFEILKSHQLSAISYQLSVEVIPGISALNACAARLGAPLMHDFASISLSDRLTPWKLIEKRLAAAAMSDFVIVLYNPKSKGRPKHIERAREIILNYRNPKTPVGIVKGAMREDERIFITDLKKMLEHEIDMQTTVIIGNSQTFVWNNRMITPRGYEKKIKN